MAHARSWFAFALAALLLGVTGCGSGDDVAGGDHVDAGTLDPDASPDAPPELPETTITAQPPALTNQPSRFELASSIAGSTFRCTLDGGTEAPCGSPFEPVVGDGPHALEVYAISPAGARDTTPARATWTVDTTPPTTTLVVAPPAHDNSERATFQFESESEVTFACAVDGAPFAACASPFQTPALLDGEHTFDVWATDLAGNVEAQPRRHVWSLDRSTPDTTIDSGPAAATSATAASFAFSSPDAGPGASFTCARDELASAPCASPWTVDGLTDGVHTVRIAVRDAAGNVDPSPATRTWRVDTTPPTVQITSGPDGPTRDATPSFDFVRGDGGHPVTTECRITGSGATDFAPCAQRYTATTIPDGDATFVIRARDLVGLETTVERTFLVDTVAPVITITAAPDEIITTSEAGLVFSVTGATIVECALDARNWAPCTGSHQVAVLEEGPHSLHVRARDAAGNQAQAIRDFSRDTQAPTITVEGPTSTANPEPHFAIDIVDLGSGVTSTCQLDDLPAVTPCRWFMAPPLEDGEHRLTVTAVDEVGHVASAVHVFTVDTRVTEIRFTSLPPAVSSNPRPTVTFTVIGAADIRRCRADEQPWQDCDTTWTVPTPLADGRHTISVLVHNGFNGATMSTTPYFWVDSAHE